MSHKIVRWFIILVLGVGLSIVARPQTALAAGPWYVALTGDDGNDCLTPATACATINAAIGKASGGDTVYVAEGTYTGSGDEVVLLDRDITLSGGWDSTFNSLNGLSVIDGEHFRKGIHVNDSVTAVVEGFTIQNGSAVQGSGFSLHGGGVYNGGNLTLHNVVVTGNRAQNGGGISNGGGVSNSVGNLTMENTWVNGNSASDAGGGIYNYIGALTVQNSAVSNNTAGDAGGGILNFCCSGPSGGGTVLLTNSTVSTNNAGRGGGISNAGSLIANNSTVSRNFSRGNFGFGSGGIDNGYGGSVALKNSILADNTAPPFLPSQDCAGPINSSGFNIVGNLSGCTFNAGVGDLTNLDAKLGLLIGSPAYHPLQSDSPAIDAGNPAGCTDQDGNLLDTDQRGATRTGNCDIGAYEYTVPGPVTNLMVMEGDAQSILVNQSFPSPLQVAALDNIGSPVNGAVIDFTAPESGPSGTFADTGTNNTSDTSNESGLATAALFTANDQAGSYTLSASTAAVASVSFHLENIGLPPNDNFSNAQVIGSLPFLTTADNTNASIEPGEPVGCGTLFRSLWYSFTPSENVALRVAMPQLQVGGTLSIFQAAGPSISDLNFIACASTGGSTNVQMNAGETYYLRLDSFGQPGSLQFSAEQITPPANDNFANAEEIGTLPFSASVDNASASIEFAEPFGCISPFRSVWYSFTPAENMALRLDMPVSQVGGATSIFLASGPTFSDLNFLSCAFSGNSRNFQVEGGEKYYLRVDSFGQLGVLQFTLEQISPPANDSFVNATAINSLPFDATVDNTDATAEFGEPVSCNFPFRSLWYSFTPAVNTAFRVVVDSQAATSVNVFSASGSTFSDLTSLGCATNGVSTNFQLYANEIYYLRVDSFGQPSVLQFHLEQIFPPANDNFGDAQAIDALPFSATVDNTDATVEANEPTGCSMFAFRSAWYSFTPAEDMTLRVGMGGSSVFGIANAFLASGPSLSDLTFLTCGSTDNPTNLRVEAGQTYYFRIDSFGQAGLLQINLEQIFPPANDDFADAQAISALPFNVTVDNTNATAEPNEPTGCSMFAFRSLWYSFTPSEDMALRLSTAGSLVSSNVSLFQAAGPDISDLNFLGCAGSTPTQFHVEAGQTYYLRLDSFGQGGSLQLNLAEANPPVNDNLANAASINSLPFTASVDITDATTEPNESHFCHFMPNTVWYSFTPTETMTLRANTFGSSISGNVSIYRSSGTGFFNLQFLACSGPSSSPSFTAEAGETYYLQAGAAFGESGTVTVNLVQTNPPANDNLASAIDVTSLPFSATVDITDATNEPGEPQVCSFMPTTAWYSFTPTEEIKVRTDTQGSTINANVNVYHATGDGFSGLENLGCSIFSSGVTSFLAQAGEAYYLQVGGSGEPGTVQLNVAEMPTISGRVTDAVTGAPLPGDTPPNAFVTLQRDCGGGCFEFVNSQYADSEGRFVFDSYYFGAPLPAGSYRLEISANQYLTTQFGPFEFSGTSIDLGDVPVSPSSIIRGRAVDSETGNPVAGASVTLNRCFSGGCFEFVNSQNTDGNGQFHFNSFYYGAPLPGGTYELLFSDSLHQPTRIEIEIDPGEDRDLGDVALPPYPLIGSISGRLLDAATGNPIPSVFTPGLNLYRCDEGGCSWVNSMTPDSKGRFRFETDYTGNRLISGAYRIVSFADQYHEKESEIFEVGEGIHKAVGDIRLTSFPVRFSEMTTCAQIPSSGGECVFSIKVTNGTSHDLTGKAWSMVNGSLPLSFAGYTNFQTRDPRNLALGRGQSQVFSFQFTVPANPGPYGTYMCTRVFVGEGGQAFLNTIGLRDMFCVLWNAGGFAIVSPQEVTATAPAAVTTATAGTEIEPNNSCQTAQDVGAVSDPFVMNGNLDSSQAPDVDFYRFSATSGQAMLIDLEGQSTGKGTLSDPFLGFFDSNCNLIALNDDSGSLNSHLEITIPEDGVFVLAATICCDSGFFGGGNGSYQLTVAPVQYIGSINGVVTDAVTGRGLIGDATPYAFVRLLQCGVFGCFDVNSQNVGNDGGFHFETDSSGNALRVGNYMIVASADQYHPRQTEIFTVSDSEDYDVGTVALDSYPIRFSDIQTCSVPSDGGLCDFSVKVTNGLTTRFSGKAWSNIDAYNLGSFVNFANFQAGSLANISLDPGRSTVLRFRFQVRGSVPDGAIICATAFVGENPSPFFDTAGVRFLFCFEKGSQGFTLLSEQQMQAHLHRIERHQAPKLDVPSLKR